MPRYLIDFVLDESPDERVEVDLPDIEAARMFVLQHLSSVFKDREDVEGDTKASTTIQDENGEILDTIYSVADWVSE